MTDSFLESLDPSLRINFVPVTSKLNWDEYFILLAMLASYRSKDPNTKVGCVFVDKNHHQISMGYNGAIAGLMNRKFLGVTIVVFPLEYQKYGYVMHSEANAIAHASRSLEHSTAYVTLFPCNECAKLMASQKSLRSYTSRTSTGTSENQISKTNF